MYINVDSSRWPETTQFLRAAAFVDGISQEALQHLVILTRSLTMFQTNYCNALHHQL